MMVVFLSQTEIKSSYSPNVQNAFVLQLSPYNYERIEVVLKIIQAADENVTGFSISQVKIYIFKFDVKCKKIFCRLALNLFYCTGDGPPSAPEILQASLSSFRHGEHLSSGKQPPAQPPVQQQASLPPSDADHTLLEDHL